MNFLPHSTITSEGKFKSDLQFSSVAVRHIMAFSFYFLMNLNQILLKTVQLKKKIFSWLGCLVSETFLTF